MQTQSVECRWLTSIDWFMCISVQTQFMIHHYIIINLVILSTHFDMMLKGKNAMTVAIVTVNNNTIQVMTIISFAAYQT